MEIKNRIHIAANTAKMEAMKVRLESLERRQEEVDQGLPASN